MCWTLEISLAFGTAALVLAACVWSFWDHRNARCGATVVAYFALMEFVQAAQHFVLAADADPTTTCARGDNRFLTAVALAHVCFQPLMLHWYSVRAGALPTPVLRMVLVGCLVDAAAMVYANLRPPMDYDWEACRGGQWGAGAMLCTTRGSVHLAWSTPMPSPSYEYHGALHSFVWFARKESDTPFTWNPHR